MSKSPKRRKVYKAKTLQIGNRLLILDGHNPLRYVNLATNKVHEYKPRRKSKQQVNDLVMLNPDTSKDTANPPKDGLTK